jgi:hypothetical protein
MRKLEVNYELKKIRQVKPDGDLNNLFNFNYNSNNKVKETLLSFDAMLAPSVNPVAKNP